MLIALLITPLIGIIAIIPISSYKINTNSSNNGSNSVININTISNNEGVQTIKVIALVASLITFVISIILWGEFDSNIIGYQFNQEFNKVGFFTFKLGVDGISLYFILLTTFITPICILSNWDNIATVGSDNNNGNIKYFLIAFLLLDTLLIAVFTVCDLLLFYVFFESVLIPLFLIVGVWGGSSTKVRAAFLLFLYTLFGSLFMLLAFLVIYNNVGSTDFQVVSLCDINVDYQKILWLGIFISMAVKTPLFPFHIWLPYAHSEAPVGGSILLAGVILKLATYGYMRILLQFLPDASYYYGPFVQTMAVISIIYASLVTLRQTDFKKLVAYSSVAHMGVVVLGLFSNTAQGIEGAILLSVAHGFVSPALFILVGGVLYDRYHTRIIKYYRGITVYMPVFSIVFFLFTIFNAGVPLSANWAGEMLALTGIFQTNPVSAILGSTGIVLSAAYSIWLYNRISFGSWSPHLSYTTDLSRREFMLLMPLIVGTLVFGFSPNILLDQIHMSVSSLIYS